MRSDAQIVDDSSRFQLHFQQTVVTQYHPGFSAPYSGPNSMGTKEEGQTSLTATLFTGVRLSKNTAVYFNPEIAGGAGLSRATGAAGFPNGETFRVGNPKPQVYVARLFVTQYIPLSKAREAVSEDVNELAGTVPQRYIQVTAGRFAISDFFDNNSYSHDARTQFLNWSLMGNGAYDYAANTRGYTWGAVIAYVVPGWAVRAGAALVPTTANASIMDGRIKDAHALQLEAERNWGQTRKGAVRLLLYTNGAHMGNYNQAVAEASASGTLPDVTTTRAYRRNKTGLGINAEQQISEHTGVFVRAGWNDGRTETWMFTEIDQSVSAGISGNPSFFKRNNDLWGLAFVLNGISKEHRNYLAAGGTGFMIGDGRLNYAPEGIAELFYSMDVHDEHFYVTPDYQFILNPAYNKDRGPLHVFSLRVHSKF